MSIDLRVKHDLESRRRAVELFDAGVGCKPAAEALSVPRETVREWQWVYRAFGSEALRPRPKGRPRGSRSKPRARTREQELEERCRRLEAEVAYLKKLRALVERDGL